MCGRCELLRSGQRPRPSSQLVATSSDGFEHSTRRCRFEDGSLRPDGTWTVVGEWVPVRPRRRVAKRSPDSQVVVDRSPRCWSGRRESIGPNAGRPEGVGRGISRTGALVRRRFVDYGWYSTKNAPVSVCGPGSGKVCRGGWQCPVKWTSRAVPGAAPISKLVVCLIPSEIKSRRSIRRRGSGSARLGGATAGGAQMKSPTPARLTTAPPTINTRTVLRPGSSVLAQLAPVNW